MGQLLQRESSNDFKLSCSEGAMVLAIAIPHVVAHRLVSGTIAQSAAVMHGIDWYFSIICSRIRW
jgi:hypothetical protein